MAVPELGQIKIIPNHFNFRILKGGTLSAPNVLSNSGFDDWHYLLDYNKNTPVYIDFHTSNDPKWINLQYKTSSQNIILYKLSVEFY